MQSNLLWSIIHHAWSCNKSIILGENTTKNRALFVNVLSSVAAVSFEVAIGRTMTTRLAKIAHAVKLWNSILVRSVSSKGRNNTVSSHLKLLLDTTACFKSSSKHGGPVILLYLIQACSCLPLNI